MLHIGNTNLPAQQGFPVHHQNEESLDDMLEQEKQRRGSGCQKSRGRAQAAINRGEEARVGTTACGFFISHHGFVESDTGSQLHALKGTLASFILRLHDHLHTFHLSYIQCHDDTVEATTTGSSRNSLVTER